MCHDGAKNVGMVDEETYQISSLPKCSKDVNDGMIEKINVEKPSADDIQKKQILIKFDGSFERVFAE